MHEHPTQPTYLTTACQVRDALTQTMQQAIATLPQAVTRQHFIASQHSPAPWRSVEAAYMAQVPRDQRLLETVTNVALLSEALAAVVCVTTSTPQTEREQPLDLSLRKVKRVEAR